MGRYTGIMGVEEIKNPFQSKEMLLMPSPLLGIVDNTHQDQLQVALKH
jgi:hypothetical protein